LSDTLKQSHDQRIAATLDRDDKWLAQTPQMFKLGPLIQAMEAGSDLMTDESSAMEHQGLRPLLVKASALNIKVTYPEDFLLAQAVLAARTK
jgi:2-C-methyl-D-erythritol 4-phosphate cytidylyltransferase